MRGQFSNVLCWKISIHVYRLIHYWNIQVFSNFIRWDKSQLIIWQTKWHLFYSIVLELSTHNTIFYSSMTPKLLNSWHIVLVIMFVDTLSINLAIFWRKRVEEQLSLIPIILKEAEPHRWIIPWIYWRICSIHLATCCRVQIHIPGAIQL